MKHTFAAALILTMAAPVLAESLKSLPPETGTIANYYKQTIYTPKELKIGEIDDVLVDKAGKIIAFIVGVGGFLGVGERNVRRTLQLGQVNEEE